MRRLVAAINMTLDGVCDHTAVTPGEDIHQHYTDLIRGADTILYGRITYQLMESFWPTLVKNPSGDASFDGFASAIDNISKVLFSHTLKEVQWKNARVAKRSIQEEVSHLRQQDGKDILVGSRSLILPLMKLNLIDEFQLTVHPVIAGKGMLLFENINERIGLKLLKTKRFEGGAMTLYYEPVKN